MKTQTMQDMLHECIDTHFEDDYQMATDTVTFEMDGVLTNDHGLIIKTQDGSEFQITIVKKEG